LNLEVFYSSLLTIISKSNDKCPACDTVLTKVKVNPYEKANFELKKLERLKYEKESFNILEKELTEDWFNWCIEIINIYQECLKNFDELNFDSLDQLIDKLRNILKENKNNLGKINLVFKFVDFFDNNFEAIISFYKSYIRLYRMTIRYKEEISQLKKSVNEIDFHIVVLNSTKDQIKTINSKLIKINDRLNSFNKNLSLLKQKKQAEDNYNKFVEDVSISYKVFLDDLINFKNKIEQEQIEDICDTVLSYYQAINKSDEPSEFVTEIKFILKDGNYRINFRTEDSIVEKDAHACLSEGHLRALGLSIMLAVAEKNNVPFLIFDDVVNAIDTEHRANIIELIFNNIYLKKTQMIITTHDRLFWERFCNTYQRVCAKEKNGRFDISHILSYTNKGTIIKQYNISFEDKIIKALENYDIRQALVYSRIWFETIATNYCTIHGKKLIGIFSKKTPSNLLKPTLESIYDILEKDFPNQYFIQVVKKDLINWSGQNQEHHAFDEINYNFVHSKTSDEVYAIFEAIRDFADFIDTEEQIKHIDESLEKYEKIYAKEMNKLKNESFVQNAPKAEVLKAKNSMNESEWKLKYYKERKGKITKIIQN
jgi:DNA sulfur modification protein DndD